MIASRTLDDCKRLQVPVGVRPGAAARRAPAGGSQRPPSGPQDSHRRGRGGRAGAQGTQPLGFARAVPLFGGASLRSALRKPRCGDSVAVPARGVHRADASGGRRAGGRGGRPWVVGERRQSAQAQLGRGVPPVVPAAARRRVGVLVGGRHLQRPSQRARAAVRAGGHWRERPRRETLPGHRGRGARVHPELARGAAGDEAARLHAPGEARRGRRGTGVLGGAVGGVSNDPEPSAAGCTRPGTS